MSSPAPTPSAPGTVWIITGWTVLDTADLTVEQTVDALLAE